MGDEAPAPEHDVASDTPTGCAGTELKQAGLQLVIIRGVCVRRVPIRLHGVVLTLAGAQHTTPFEFLAALLTLPARTARPGRRRRRRVALSPSLSLMPTNTLQSFVGQFVRLHVADILTSLWVVQLAIPGILTLEALPTILPVPTWLRVPRSPERASGAHPALALGHHLKALSLELLDHFSAETGPLFGRQVRPGPELRSVRNVPFKRRTDPVVESQFPLRVGAGRLYVRTESCAQCTQPEAITYHRRHAALW